MTTCQFGSIASRQSVHHDDCTAPATYEAVDILAPALERVQRPVCAGHARFLHGQGFWIFPQGDSEAQSLELKDIVDPEPATEPNNKPATHRTLQELTGVESGLVLYHQGHEAICCNWTSIEGLPRMFGSRVIGLGEEIPHVEGEPVTDVRELLEGFTLAHDDSNGDVFGESEGTAYAITDDVTVVTFEGWC